MILSDLQSWQAEKSAFPTAVNAALNELAELDLSTMAPGRYPLRVEGSFFMIQTPTTGPVPAQRPEAHQQHVDIQLVLSGHERYGFAKRGQAGEAVQEDRWERHDIAFFATPAAEDFFDLAPGMFAVFFPSDIHRPGCQVGDAPETLRKVVVKIHRSLFGL